MASRKAKTEKPASLNDAAYIGEFADTHARALAFDPRMAMWRVYNCHTWHETSQHEGTAILANRAIEYARRRYSEAPSEFEIQAAVNYAQKYFERKLSFSGINNTVKAAQMTLSLHCAEWDPIPTIVGVKNGVVDLLTGQLRPGRPDDRIAHVANAEYDPAANCPRWIQFLHDITGSDDDTVNWLQRFFGYALSGETGERALLWLHGRGSNGKSTLIRILSHVFGSYASNASIASFQRGEFEQGSDRATPSLVRMWGRRLVFASEANPGVRWDVAKLKALTGRDKIVARQLHQQEFEFESVAKFVFAMNTEPDRIEDPSDGFWKRLRPIELTRSFPDDASIEPKILAEAPGILAWLVRGYQLQKAEGLGTTAGLTSAVEALRYQNNPIAEFLDECIERVEPIGDLPPASESASDLYISYCKFSDRRQVRPISMMAFTRYMRVSFNRYRDKHGVRYSPLYFRPGIDQR